MNSVASVLASSRARAGDWSVTATSMRAVFGGTFVALTLAANSGAVIDSPSLSMTRWLTTSLVNTAIYELTRPATTWSFWYAAAVVDPWIDTISCVVDTNLAGVRRTHAKPRANTTAATGTNVFQYRLTEARNAFSFNVAPSFACRTRILRCVRGDRRGRRAPRRLLHRVAMSTSDI